MKKVEISAETDLNNKIISVLMPGDRKVSRIEKFIPKKSSMTFREYCKGIAHFYSTPMVLFVNNAVKLKSIARNC